jgi:hypothetical protein
MRKIVGGGAEGKVGDIDGIEEVFQPLAYSWVIVDQVDYITGGLHGVTIS